MTAADPVAFARAFLAAWPGRREAALAVLGGAIGDRLHDAGSPLAIPTRLHAPPQLGPSLCVFVHGLMASPGAWSGGEVDYAAALRERLAVDTVHAHYNTGRHISTNGRELARELEAAIDPDAELSFVAHSMGGLVVRSACHYGLAAGHRWVQRLARVFLLGVPAHGAPLEQVVHVAAFTLRAIWNPWTRLIGRAIDLRSAGIKDLRHGFVLDEDWRHIDVDELRFAVPRRPLLPPHAKWYAIAGALGPDPRRAWPRIIGDGLVREPSTRGHGFGCPDHGLLLTDFRIVDRTSHLRLMTDPVVLGQIVRWWEC